MKLNSLEYLSLNVQAVEKSLLKSANLLSLIIASRKGNVLKTYATSVVINIITEE